MADYDVDKYNALISLEVPYKIALALASDVSPLNGDLDDALVAANVAVFATPGTATAADAATKINAVINALVAAGLMEEPA